MNGNYLIPANTKAGQLILNMFKPVDLVIVISAAVEILAGLLLMNSMEIDAWYYQLLAILPGIIMGILVIKIPYYHNVRTLINDIYVYYSYQHTFKWRGWYKDVTK